MYNCPMAWGISKRFPSSGKMGRKTYLKTCPNSELWKEPIQRLSAQMFFYFSVLWKFFFATTWYQDEVEAFESSQHDSHLRVNDTSIWTSQVLSVRPGFALGLFHGFFQENVSVPSLVARYFFAGSRQGIATSPPPQMVVKSWEGIPSVPSFSNKFLGWILFLANISMKLREVYQIKSRC